MAAKRKFLVTGGAGFLGSHVCGEILQRGDSVVALDDFSNGKPIHLELIKNHPNLTVTKGDIRIRKDVESAVRGCDTLIHLATLCLRESIKDPKRVNNVIVDGTINCLEVAHDFDLDLFLNCSSSEVFGSAVYVPMDEKHPLMPETPYAAAKVAQDMLVRSYGSTYGLNWTTIRPFNMYGPNSHWQGHRGELIPKMIVRAMNGKPLIVFGDGNQKRDFLFVTEAAKALLAVADSPDVLEKTVNFCTGVETSVLEIASQICFEFGIDPIEGIEFQDPRPGDVLRHFGDSTLFSEILGFKPKIKIKEGIRLTVDWFKSLPYTPEELLQTESIRNWE